MLWTVVGLNEESHLKMFYLTDRQGVSECFSGTGSPGVIL